MSETNPTTPTTATNIEYAVHPKPARSKGRGVRTLGILMLAAGAFTGGMAMRNRVIAFFSPHTPQKGESKAGEAKQLYTCGMHPQVIQDKPGTCPICHMELTPLHAHRAGESQFLTIDPVIVQNMGVRTAVLAEGPLQQDVRVVGYVDEPEPAQRDVNLRVSGWIEKLYADAEGIEVKEGEPLFDLYSPEVQVAIDELIAARRSRDALPADADGAVRRTSDTMYEASQRKLALWGLQPKQIEQFGKLDTAPATITVLSPITGHVAQKLVVNGAAVKAGDMVMRLSDRSKMWVEAQVYERQLPLVKVGQKAVATTASQPGKSFEGKVVFLHPHIDPATRTAKVRVLLANDDHTLQRGMYATVQIVARPVERTLLVPREAILDTGTRQVAFIALGEGRFEPRDLKVGLSGSDGMVQVIDGLKVGDKVVTSGQFLLDSESRLKEAIAKHLSGGLKGHEAKAAATPAVTKLDVPHADDIVAAYLDVQKVLGAKGEDDATADVSKLIAAARMSAEHGKGDGKAIAEKVLATAEKMKAATGTEQRKAFAATSAAVIELAERATTSKTVGEKLYVAHCPMVPGGGADWLQAGKQIANPFFAKSMKECGEVKREIATK